MATTIDELVSRRFTCDLERPENTGKTVYDLFDWSKRDVLLTDYKTGKTLCEMHDLEFPVNYSQMRWTSSRPSIFAGPAFPAPSMRCRSARWRIAWSISGLPRS